MMRIGMAVGTFAERDAGVLHIRLRRRNRGMAFLASDARVRAGQRKLCRRMIEFRRRLPARLRMATGAIRAQLAIVFIRVAGIAFPRKPQVRVIQILDDDRPALAGRNVLCIVALIARQSRVLPD